MSRLEASPVAHGAVADALAQLRGRVPLVQCLTNIVVANFTANVLLAAGASPAMVDNPAEAAAFARLAGGVLVNLGTPYPDTTQAMAGAAASAAAASVPWVLDPVAAGVLGWRTGIALELLAAHHPAIVRGNASEIMALGGGRGGRGVDALVGAEQALAPAAEIATRHATVVAVSGEVDFITDGRRLVRLANGHPLLTRVTGAGCALGALMAACAAVVADPLLAAVVATTLLNVAGEHAAAQAAGPGSFAVALLDQLAALTPQAVADQLREP